VVNVNAPTMGTYGAEWEAYGYAGCGNVAALVNFLTGRNVIIAGNAGGVFYELTRAMEHADDPLIFAVNDVGMFLPHVDHWVSLHGDNFKAWKAVRWLHSKGPEDTKYHSIASYDEVNYVWDKLTPLMALSGYFAMQIAHIMGAQRIILCGCPGMAARRFFEASPRRDFGYGGGLAQADKNIQEQLIKETTRVPDLRMKVRSMSGWTLTYFGSP
jgi:hypothetical protein